MKLVVNDLFVVFTVGVGMCVVVRRGFRSWGGRSVGGSARRHEGEKARKGGEQTLSRGDLYRPSHEVFNFATLDNAAYTCRASWRRKSAHRQRDSQKPREKTEDSLELSWEEMMSPQPL